MSNINTATARLLLLAAIIQLTLSGTGADAQNNDIPWFRRHVAKLTCTSTADRWRVVVKTNVHLKQAEMMGRLYMNSSITPCTTVLEKACRNWDADFVYLGQCDKIIPKGMEIGCIKKSNKILQCFSNVVVRGYDGLLKKLRYNLKKCLAQYPHIEDGKQIFANVTKFHEDFMKTIKNDLERRYKLVANESKDVPDF